MTTPAPPPGFRPISNAAAKGPKLQPPPPPPGFRPLAEPAEQPQQEPEVKLSTLEEIAGPFRMALGQGAALGYGDELFGRVRGLITGEGTDAAVAAEREAVERYRKARPIAATASEIGGAFVPFVGPLGRFYRAAQTLPGKVARGAATATVAGGVYRSGQAEGGVSKRAKAAADVSEVEPLIGGALPVAGRVLSPVAGGIKQLGSEIVGRIVPSRSTLAEDRIISALRDAGMTPAQARARYEAGQAATRMGPNSVASLPEAIVDIAGKPGRRLGFTTAATSGRGARIAERALEGRQKQQFERLTDDIRRALGVSSEEYAPLMDKLRGKQKAAADPAYEAFRNHPVRIDVGDILFNRYLKDPNLTEEERRLLWRALGHFSNYSSDPKEMALMLVPGRFDRGKQALDKMIAESYVNNKPTYLTRTLMGLRQELVDEADRATTVTRIGPNGKPETVSLYKEARDAFAGPAALMRAMEEGRAFAKGDSEITAAAYKALSKSEQKMFRLGVAREIEKMLGRQKRGADMTQIFQRPNIQQILDEVIPKGRTIRPRQNFMELVDRERGMTLSRNKVLSGSDTAERLEALATPENLSAFGRYIRSSGGLANAAVQALHDATMQILKVRERDAERIARMLFATNPATVRATFDRLERRYGKQNVRQLRRFLDRYMAGYISSATVAAQPEAAQESLQ